MRVRVRVRVRVRLRVRVRVQVRHSKLENRLSRLAAEKEQVGRRRMAARHLESDAHGRTLPAILTIMALLTNLYLVIAIIVSSHSITSTYYGTLKPTHGETLPAILTIVVVVVVSTEFLTRNLQASTVF